MHTKHYVSFLFHLASHAIQLEDLWTNSLPIQQRFLLKVTTSFFLGFPDTLQIKAG